MLMCPTLCIGSNPREYFKIFDSVQEVLVSMMCLLRLLWLREWLGATWLGQLASWAT